MTPFRRKLLMKKKGSSERLVYELAEWDFHNGTLDIRDYFGGVIGKTYRFVWDWTLKATVSSNTIFRIQCGRMTFSEGAVFSPTHTIGAGGSIDSTEHCDNLRTTSNTNTFAQLNGYNRDVAEICKLTNIKIYEVS